MKRTSLFALCVLILGAVIAVGSVSFLGPCVHEDGSYGACHWAGQAMLGIGLLLTAQGIAALLLKDGRVRAGLLLSTALTAVLGTMIPGTLIDLCRMATMHCRAVMRPAMILLCALAAILSVIGFLTEYRKSGKAS